MSTAVAPCLVESSAGPGRRLYVKSRADVPPEAVWYALKDFSEERPTWWPFIHPPVYAVHDVGERSADVTEGTKLGPGKTIWARERYEWDDATMEIRTTVLESNIFKPGGVARIKVTPAEGGGCYVEEWYERERVGLLGWLMTKMMPRMLPKMVDKGRAKTYAILAERQPHLTAR